MSQDDDEIHASAQVIDGVFQTSKHVHAQTIAGHSNYEKIVWPFVEDQFDRHPSI